MEDQVSPLVLMVPLVLSIGLYLYMSLCFYMMAKKTNTPNPGLVFVPIVNLFVVPQIAGKPGWWGILLCIPLVNLAISIVIFMEISKRLGKPEWVGVLMIVPVVNLIVPAYLAFAK